jgi:hypothetical protein
VGLKMDKLLEEIVSKLTVDGGLEAWAEYPGCVIVPHSNGTDTWWFGTANGTWEGDLMKGDGLYADETLQTGIQADCTDAGHIALAIAAALLDDGIENMDPDYEERALSPLQRANRQRKLKEGDRE